MVCNNILFLILTQNAFLASLLLPSANAAFFIGITFSANVLEGMTDRNVSTFCFGFFKP